MNLKAELAGDEKVHRMLVRMAYQIIEKNHGTDNICLIGIRTRGVPLAERIAQNLERSEGVKVPVGELDITLYRDDLTVKSRDPILNSPRIPFSIVDKHVILVDDVIYTGRTARAALDAITTIGRPASIQLAVLVDRGHRELPIRADYVGMNTPTSHSEVVSVQVKPIDGENKIYLFEKTV